MQNQVSIGPTTVAGWGTAAIAFIAAIITYLTGDHSARSVTAVEVAGIGLVSFVITQGFRYLQAHKILPSGTALPSTEEELLTSPPNGSQPPIPPDVLQVG